MTPDSFCESDIDDAFFDFFMENIGCYIKREKRKTLSLSVTSDGTPAIKAPMKMRTDAIIAFVKAKRNWLLNKRAQTLKALERAKSAGGPLSPSEARDLKAAARDYITARAAFYAPVAGVEYGKLGFRFMKSRWGSCSPSGDLHFNVLLMLADKELIDSVVVHELCHIGCMNHSDAFYDKVLKIMPDYFERQKRLRKVEREILLRLPDKA